MFTFYMHDTLSLSLAMIIWGYLSVHLIFCSDWLLFCFHSFSFKELLIYIYIEMRDLIFCTGIDYNAKLFGNQWSFWFFCQVTPFPLWDDIGNGQSQAFPPKTCSKFSKDPMSYTFGPIFGFLCLSKLSKVLELESTSSTWNLKNVLITIKKVNWITNPNVLIIVNASKLDSCWLILIYSLRRRGI